MRLQVYGPQVRQDGDFTVTVNGSSMKKGGAGFAVIDLDELGNVQLTFDTAEDIDRLITAAREAKRMLTAARVPHPFRAAEPGGYRCDECSVSKGHHVAPEGSDQ